jgi:hypothetical protein
MGVGIGVAVGVGGVDEAQPYETIKMRMSAMI